MKDRLVVETREGDIVVEPTRFVAGWRTVYSFSHADGVFRSRDLEAVLRFIWPYAQNSGVRAAMDQARVDVLTAEKAYWWRKYALADVRDTFQSRLWAVEGVQVFDIDIRCQMEGCGESCSTTFSQWTPIDEAAVAAMEDAGWKAEAGICAECWAEELARERAEYEGECQKWEVA